MRITVEGFVYQLQRHGGISRLFNEILPRMCDLETSLEIAVMTDTAPLLQPVPSHDRIRARQIPQANRWLRPYRLWQPYHGPVQRTIDRLYLGSGRGQIWHPTYYASVDHWRGRRAATVYDMAHERFPELFNTETDELFRRQKQRCLDESDLVICISEATSRDVQAFCGVEPSRIRVTHLAHGDVFHEPLREEGIIRMSPEKPFFLYVGDRNHYKNFHRLLEAFGAWPGHQDVDLVVVGGGPWTDQEQQVINRHQLQRRVHHRTGVDDRELAGLYRKALGFVYPSLYEGFGIPLLEAMACGCPVVASRIPTTEEVAGDCPIYFEPSTAESFRAALEQAARDQRSPERVNAGRARAAMFSWDRTARETLDVYRELTV